MAEKRMFTKKITNSDDFLAMPHSTQNLYFHLNMEADDEGFVNSPKRIMRTILSSEDDLKLLITKRFVIAFHSGVIVIKHWKLHNTLRKDRLKETDYKQEKSLLVEKENGVYTERKNLLSDTCQTDDGQTDDTSPLSIVEYSIVEDSIGKEEKKRTSRFIPPTKEELDAYIQENNYNVNSDKFLSHYESVGWKVGKNKMKDWKASVRGWHTRNKENVSTKFDEPEYMKQVQKKNIDYDDEKRKQLLEKLKKGN